MLYVRAGISEPGLHLFQRPVHPELLEICCARYFERERYVLRTAVTTAGHCISFCVDGQQQVTEICAGLNEDLPKRTRLLSCSLDEHQCEEMAVGANLLWQSRFSLDAVDSRIFLAIQAQLDEQGECEGLVHRFRPEQGGAIPAVSYVNFQAFARHAIVRTFHTFPGTLMVARTESRFRII